MPLSLEDFPEFRALLERCECTERRLAQVEQQLPEWVDEQEAQRLTGLSHVTLWRERKNPNRVIVWKQDHGVRYQRASLLAHNLRRTAAAA